MTSKLQFIILCLIFINVLTIVSIEGRSLRRRHTDLEMDYYNNEADRFNDRSNLKPASQHAKLHHHRRKHLGLPDELSTLREHVWRPVAGLQMKGSDESDSMRFDLSLAARRKRHNGGRFGTVSYKAMTDFDRKSYLKSRMARLHPKLYSKQDNKQYYEVEVKEAQNSSICNYTVVPIPDPTGTRIPKDLDDVVCNYVGSRCQDSGTFCCIQTYRKVEVSYTDRPNEILKVYAGCVCSLQLFGELRPYEPEVPLGD